MTAPAENPPAGEKHSGGLAQLVRWLNEERSATGDDLGLVAGAPRRVARWTYGDPPIARPTPEPERDTLGEVRIGPAPRCAVAGETIALSVSLISTGGGLYLGWPIKLEWSSSDPSVASVSEGGVVQVHARGRVEITCTCEGKSGSVLLSVVEPAVAAAVGLPVPARLLASHPGTVPFPRPAMDADAEPAIGATSFAPRPPVTPGELAAAQHGEYPGAIPSARPAAAVAALPAVRDLPPQSIPLDLPPQAPPVHRRSVERGAARYGVLAGLAPSRATRRFLFRVAVGTATGTFVVVALSQSPEEYFVVGPESTAMAAQVSPRPSAARRGASAIRNALRPRLPLPASATSAADRSAPLGDTSRGAMLTRSTGRTVAEAAGTTLEPKPAPPAPAPATQPAATQATPTVSRVVFAPSPSQLTEGESVRLTAAGVDDRGDTVAGRGVTWTSEDDQIAVVDGSGVVTARRPGTVTIFASSEGRVGRVTLTVGARRVAPPASPTPAPTTAAASTPGTTAAASTTAGAAAPAPTPAPARESGTAAVANVIRVGVDEFVQALRERNTERVASLYRAESAQDRKNLQALAERLRRPEARFKASDAQIAAPVVREMEAVAEFHLPMSWTTPFGRVRSQTATFRAVLEPGDGGWRVVAIRAVGKID